MIENIDKFAKLAFHIFQEYIPENSNVGLGSGSTVVSVIQNIKKLDYLASLKFVTTSLQIKIIAENLGLKVFDEGLTEGLDVVIDGADQVDSKFNLIKGGGGALLKEKIIISTAKKFVICANSKKFVDNLQMAVPIEIHPFARKTVFRYLSIEGGTPTLRVLEKGYPFITESGNLIYDTNFGIIKNPSVYENRIKAIPGVIEVGIFSKIGDGYYKFEDNGDFSFIQPSNL